jgi:hypothetical protein
MDKKNTKINLDFANFLILYKHYKDYILPLIMIVSSILVFFVVVIPQFQQYFSAQAELKIETGKLQVLKNNYNFLANLNNAKIGADFSALSYALPAGKDFAGIMNAISFVSAKTGIPVGDFNFSLGNLSNEKTEGFSAVPSVKIEVNLVGSSREIMRFIAELYKTIPVSEVTSIKTGGNLGTIAILFYYRPFPPRAIDNSAPILDLSNQESALVKNVSLWNNAVDQSLMPVIPSIFSGSENATPSSSQGNSGPF